MEKILEGTKLRVYIDDIEEWKVFSVKEILEETKLGFRYLLEDLNGNTLVRIVDFSNNQKRFGAKPVMEFKDGSKMDWQIHYVFDERGVSIHTHGVNKYIERELEMTLPLEQKTAMNFLNLIAMNIANGNIDVFDCAEIENIFSCPIRIVKCKEFFEEDIKAKKIFRVIFPDANMVFPGEEGCNERYENQIKSLS